VPTDEVLEVSGLYDLLVGHIEDAFGRRNSRWVRGEIQKYYEKGHLYLDVVDANFEGEGQPPVLKVRCWNSVWTPLKRDLAARGLALAEGQVVTFRGYVGVFRPRAEISFAVTEIDVEGLLGDAAKRRQELLEKLQRDGVLDANKARPLPDVPLRVGLVSSPRTEGFNDFTGQLIGSGLSFDVVVAATAVQGESAPSEVVAAIQRLDTSGVDVICVVRGGGSKGDLACFDDERVARAIGAATVPVLTGIGHTGDISIADLAAFHHAITPTKLGEFLVERVRDWRDRYVVTPAREVAMFGAAIVEEATEYLAERRRTVALALRDRLGAEQLRLDHARRSLEQQATHLLNREQQQLQSLSTLLGAYDPRRRLAQGWSIVTDAQGRTVRSIAELQVGSDVVIRVSDGRAVATVQRKEEE
jgi:exodeoxyribonuclease VII large subunit